MPFGDESRVIAGQHHGLDLLDHAVVLRMEHMVHGGQADVLVAAPVAGDEVAVEQFVIECALWRRVGRVVDYGVRIRRHQRAGLAVEGVGRMGDIVQEGVPGEQRITRDGDPQPTVGGRVALDEDDLVALQGDDLRKAVRPRNELAVEVGGQQRDIADVAVGQLDTQHLRGLSLDLRPGRQAAYAIEHTARGDRIAVCVQLVFTQEDLVRSMGRIGLVLIDEGRGGVERSATDDVVSGAQHAVLPRRIGAGAGQDHEVRGAALDIKRIIRLQRHENEAVVTLGHQVQAMVEELAEQGEPRVETGRQAFVRRGVGDEQRLASRNRYAVQVQQHAIGVQGSKAGVHVGLYRRRVGDGLVDDQVGDGPRIGIGHAAWSAIVGISDHASRTEVNGVAILVIAEHRIDQGRERLVRRAEVLLPRHQVVEAAIHGAKTESATGVRHDIQQVLTSGMTFGDLDLVEDELQVATDDVHAGTGDIGFLRQGRGRCNHHAAVHGCRRGREHALQHAVGILVDRPHPQGQTVEIGGHAEAVALGGFRAFAGFGDDVGEQARTGHGFPLPEVGDGTTDIPVRIVRSHVVGIRDQQRRGLQYVAIRRGGVTDRQ
ncbi:hypothetical protein D9M72_229930 [compost metagenome]